MSNIFKYNDIELPPDGIHKISPSAISKFYDYPVNYYKEMVQGEKPEFKGNTSTILGTVCHYILKKVADNELVSAEEIDREIRVYCEELVSDNVNNIDIADILLNYFPISSAIINQYLLRHRSLIEKTEFQVLCSLGDGIYLGGTLDVLQRNFDGDGYIVVDYKTTSSKPHEAEIPFHYKLQLLGYAEALRRTGCKVVGIKIVWGVKPTKTLPARCYEIGHTIKDEDYELIADTLQLIKESVLICKDHPELIHLIWKSMKLKNVTSS